MTRVLRTALGGCAVALLGSIAIALCGLGGATAQASSSSGSSLTIAWSEAPDTLNPASTGDESVGPIDANIFDTLVWLTPSGKITPDLATR